MRTLGRIENVSTPTDRSNYDSAAHHSPTFVFSSRSVGAGWGAIHILCILYIHYTQLVIPVHTVFLQGFEQRAKPILTKDER
jgi:hypothetical protein